jgi:hypothetical protein
MCFQRGFAGLWMNTDCYERRWMLLQMLLGMASILRHPQSKYFTACFRDHNGRQRRITTKETNRKKAQKLADEYERAVQTKRTLKQAQAVLDRLHEELSGERVVRRSFSSIFK